MTVDVGIEQQFEAPFNVHTSSQARIEGVKLTAGTQNSNGPCEQLNCLKWTTSIALKLLYL